MDEQEIEIAKPETALQEKREVQQNIAKDFEKLPDSNFGAMMKEVAIDMFSGGAGTEKNSQDGKDFRKVFERENQDSGKVENGVENWKGLDIGPYVPDKNPRDTLDGGQIHYDKQNRPDIIKSPKGEMTRITYGADSQVDTITSDDGLKVTREGNHWLLNGQPMKDVNVNPKSGSIDWTNEQGWTTSKYPGGGILDVHDNKIQRYQNAQGGIAEFKYDGWNTVPSSITLKGSLVQNSGMAEYKLFGDGKRPVYVQQGNPDAFGGTIIGMMPSIDTGAMYFYNPTSRDSAGQPTLDSIKVVGSSGGELNIGGQPDQNIVPKPIYDIISAVHGPTK